MMPNLTKYIRNIIERPNLEWRFFWLIMVALLIYEPVQAIAFDYNDNISFMKDVPANLKAAYPTCDAFLNLQWNHANPNPYANKRQVGPPPPEGIPRVVHYGGTRTPIWVGKALIDVYKGGQKQRRGLIVLIIGEKGIPGEFKLYRYLLPLDEYEKVVKDYPSQVFVQGTKEDDAPRQELGVIDINTGDEIRWISERFISSINYFIPTGDHYPIYSLAYLSKNICYTSPEGGTVWSIEPAQPFATDVLMTDAQNKQLQELLRLYERDCPALEAQAKHPPNLTGRWCNEGGSIASPIRRGSLRDADGDSLLDYVFYNQSGLEIIHFPNDTRPFIMMYPKECHQPPNPYDSYNDRIDDAAHLKKEQQCVAKVKEGYQSQGSSKSQSGE